MAGIDVETSRILDGVRNSKILRDITLIKQRHRLEYDTHRAERDFPRIAAGEIDRSCCNRNSTLREKNRCYFRSFLRTYSGSPSIEDLWDWIDEMEDYFVEMQAPERLKCRIASYTLEGAADCWWGQLEHHSFSWWRMKHLMAERFIHAKRTTKCPSQVHVKEMEAKNFMPDTCSMNCPSQIYDSSWNEKCGYNLVDGLCHTIEINWTDASKKDLECSEEVNQRNEMAEVIKHTKHVGAEMGEHPRAEGSMPDKCSIKVLTELNGDKQSVVSNTELLYEVGEDAPKHTGDLQHLVSNTMVLKCEESCILNSLDGLDVKSVTANPKIGAGHEDANTISALNIDSQVIYVNPSNLKISTPGSLADDSIGKCSFITSRIRKEFGCSSKVDIANDGWSRRQIHLMPSNIDFRVGKMLMPLFDPGGIFHPSRARTTSLLNENLANFVSFDQAEAKQNRCDRNFGVAIQDKSVNMGMLCLNIPLNSWMSFIIMNSKSYVPVVVNLGIECGVTSIHFPKMIDDMQVSSHFDENENMKLDGVAIGKQFAPIEISTHVSSSDLDEVDVFLFDPGGCIRSSANWGFLDYSLAMVCCTREVHSLSLQSLSKVHVIPMTFMFDPGGMWKWHSDDGRQQLKFMCFGPSWSMSTQEFQEIVEDRRLKLKMSSPVDLAKPFNFGPKLQNVCSWRRCFRRVFQRLQMSPFLTWPVACFMGSLSPTISLTSHCIKPWTSFSANLFESDFVLGMLSMVMANKIPTTKGLLWVNYVYHWSRGLVDFTRYCRIGFIWRTGTITGYTNAIWHSVRGRGTRFVFQYSYLNKILYRSKAWDSKNRIPGKLNEIALHVFDRGGSPNHQRCGECMIRGVVIVSWNDPTTLLGDTIVGLDEVFKKALKNTFKRKRGQDAIVILTIRVLCVGLSSFLVGEEKRSRSRGKHDEKMTYCRYKRLPEPVWPGCVLPCAYGIASIKVPSCDKENEIVRCHYENSHVLGWSKIINLLGFVFDFQALIEKDKECVLKWGVLGIFDMIVVPIARTSSNLVEFTLIYGNYILECCHRELNKGLKDANVTHLAASKFMAYTYINLLKNEQSMKALKLFHKMVNGLDPPLDVTDKL